MIRVKICGITNLKDAQKAIEYGAHALGFVFYKKSPRYISPIKAKRIIAQLSPMVTPVGVFVNQKENEIKRIASSCQIQILQFHGDEPPSFCQRFKNYKIIKAFRVDGPINITEIKKYKVTAVLFDTYRKNMFGGSGKTFHWAWLKRMPILRKPIILSGGLNHKNVKKAIKRVHPYAIDVSSGVESSPGKKSERLLMQLFKELHSR